MRGFAIGFVRNRGGAGDVRRKRKGHDGAELDSLLRRGAAAGRLARALERRSHPPVGFRCGGACRLAAYGGRGVLLGRSRDSRPPLRLAALRSEEHTSELQSLMRISYAVFCLKKKKINR